jgi:hypothetical protein
MTAWLDENCGADGWVMTPSGIRGVRNDAVSVYFLDATLASAFVARWCAGYKVETTEGVLRVRDVPPDEIRQANCEGAGAHRVIDFAVTASGACSPRLSLPAQRVGRVGVTRGWRRLSPSAELFVDPESGARCAVRDTGTLGAERYYWTVIAFGDHEVAAGRTEELTEARSRAEAALAAYIEDWRETSVGESSDA